MKIVLATTLHDPENRLTNLILESYNKLSPLFKSIILVTSKHTHPKINSLLQSKDHLEVFVGKESIVSTYRTAFKHAIAKNPDRIFYCDFDRILHWVNAYPEELAEIVETQMTNDLLHYGRTRRAFRSHPETQTMTESLVNKITSHIQGFQETRDFLGGCWRLTPRLANYLLHLPTSNQFGFYVEWPFYAWRKAEIPGYIEVEGLEWETPDRYLSEIRDMGYEIWSQSFQTPREWQKRVGMLSDFIESALNISGVK